MCRNVDLNPDKLNCTCIRVKYPTTYLRARLTTHGGYILRFLLLMYHICSANKVLFTGFVSGAAFSMLSFHIDLVWAGFVRNPHYVSSVAATMSKCKANNGTTVFVKHTVMQTPIHQPVVPNYNIHADRCRIYGITIDFAQYSICNGEVITVNSIISKFGMQRILHSRFVHII